MTDHRLAQIEKRIAAIKAELTEIGPMRPGSLTRQFKDPKSQSGPYYQLSYTRQMRSRTEYVPRDRLSEVRSQIRIYKRFRGLIDEWVKLGIEQCRLLMRSAARASNRRR
jgi:hypothetical protein